MRKDVKHLLGTTALSVSLAAGAFLQRGGDISPLTGSSRDQVTNSLKSGHVWPVRDANGTAIAEYAYDPSICNDEVKKEFAAAMEEIEQAANVKFVERASSKEFENRGVLIKTKEINQSEQANGQGDFPLPSLKIQNLTIDSHYDALRARFPSSSRKDDSDQNRLRKNLKNTILHELLHILGAKHPHNGIRKLSKYLDTGAVTIMSYEHTGNASALGGVVNTPVTLRQADRDFLVLIYGPSLLPQAIAVRLTAQQAEDDSVVLLPDSVETLDASGTGRNTSITMKPGPENISHIGGQEIVLGCESKVHKVTTGDNPDNIIGSSGDDEIKANGASAQYGNLPPILKENRITGGGGNDTLSGGSDPDIYYYKGNDGFDTIEGFSPAQDNISLGGNVDPGSIEYKISTLGIFLTFKACDSGARSTILLRGATTLGLSVLIEDKENEKELPRLATVTENPNADISEWIDSAMNDDRTWQAREKTKRTDFCSTPPQR